MIGNLPPVGALSNSYSTRPDVSSPRRETQGAEDASKTKASSSPASEEQDGRKKSAGTKQLSEEEQAQVAKLQQRDREVRAHEMAHVAAGGGLITKGASYSYETGPDGQRYAVGGEVSIDTSKGRTPQETIDKAARIRAAAMAPAEPSGQDRQVAAMATQMAMQASMELAMQQREGSTDSESTGKSAGAGTTGSSADDARAQRMQAAYGASSGISDDPTRNALSVFA